MTLKIENREIAAPVNNLAEDVSRLVGRTYKPEGRPVLRDDLPASHKKNRSIAAPVNNLAEDVGLEPTSPKGGGFQDR